MQAKLFEFGIEFLEPGATALKFFLDLCTKSR